MSSVYPTKKVKELLSYHASGEGIRSNLLKYFPKIRFTSPLILDVGSGITTPYKKIIEEKYWKPEYIAVDLRKSKNITVIADQRALPFQAYSFDFVFSIHAIEHVKEQDKVLRELARVSRLYLFVAAFNPKNPRYFIVDPGHKEWTSKAKWEEIGEEDVIFRNY